MEEKPIIITIRARVWVLFCFVCAPLVAPRHWPTCTFVLTRSPQFARSPVWHRAERRRRAKARRLLRSVQSVSPTRAMLAAVRLDAHHGSRPPTHLGTPSWQCMICGWNRGMAVAHCEQCQYPMSCLKTHAGKHVEMPEWCG